MFAYHSLYDSLKSDSRKIITSQIKEGECEKGGGAKIPLKLSVLNANHRAYRLWQASRNSAYIGLGYFQRGLPWPGPLGTLIGLAASFITGVVR